MMKIGSITLSLFAAAALFAVPSFAYQLTVDSSAERTQSRNATQGSIKAAYYNPAGLVNLDDGIYLDAGNRFLYMKTTNKDSAGLKASTVDMTWLLPNAAVAWKFMDRYAVFYSFNVCDGGASGMWDDAGSIDLITKWKLGAPMGTGGGVTKIEGTTYTLAHTLGFAGRVNELIAFSAGVRYSMYTSSTSIKGANVDANAVPKTLSDDGDALTGFIGVMVTPVKDLNFTANILGESRLGYTTTTKMADGSSTKNDIKKFQPTMFAFGAGYRPMNGLELQLSYTVTLFNKALLYDKKDFTDGYYTKDYIPEHNIGLGAEYSLSSMILFSGGASYLKPARRTVINTDPSDPSFDIIVVGVGAVITVDRLKIDLCLADHICFESTGGSAGNSIKHNRDAYVVGMGVSYGF